MSSTDRAECQHGGDMLTDRKQNGKLQDRENTKYNCSLASGSHEVTGMCVRGSLQRKGWLMNHYVPL